MIDLDALVKKMVDIETGKIIGKWQRAGWDYHAATGLEQPVIGHGANEEAARIAEARITDRVMSLLNGSITAKRD